MDRGDDDSRGCTLLLDFPEPSLAFVNKLKALAARRLRRWEIRKHTREARYGEGSIHGTTRPQQSYVTDPQLSQCIPYRHGTHNQYIFRGTRTPRRNKENYLEYWLVISLNCHIVKRCRIRRTGSTLGWTLLLTSERRKAGCCECSQHTGRLKHMSVFFLSTINNGACRQLVTLRRFFLQLLPGWLMQQPQQRETTLVLLHQQPANHHIRGVCVKEQNLVAWT